MFKLVELLEVGFAPKRNGYFQVYINNLIVFTKVLSC